MNENLIVKTVKMTYLEDFEQKTSEMILNGYRMISCGYVMNDTNKKSCWWAVLVKEEKAGEPE